MWPQATAAAAPRKRIAAVNNPLPRFRSAALSPDGQYALLAAGDRQDYGRLVRTDTGEAIGPPLHQPYLHHMAFSPDGRLAAAAPHRYWIGNVANTLHVRNLKTGRPHRVGLAIPSFMHALAFSPDGRTLAVGVAGGVMLLDADTGTVRRHLKEQTVAASLAFSPDGALLGAAYRSGWGGKGAGMRLWETVSGKPVGDFQPFAPRRQARKSTSSTRAACSWCSTRQDRCLFTTAGRAGRARRVASRAHRRGGDSASQRDGGSEGQ